MKRKTATKEAGLLEAICQLTDLNPTDIFTLTKITHTHICLATFTAGEIRIEISDLPTEAWAAFNAPE